jgi:hypothetical protein
MKRSLLIRAGVAIAVLMAVAEPHAPARAVVQEVWHVQRVAEGPTGVSITYFWSKGRSMRAVTVVQGRPILTLIYRDWYYVIDEVSGTGLAVQRSTQALQEDAAGGRPFAQEAELIIAQGAELVRTEKLGPTTTEVWRLTDRTGRREVWMPAGGERIPLRAVIFDRAVAEEHTVRYLGWTRNLELRDDFFRPDPRIQLERLTYAEYLKRTAAGPVGPAPVLYNTLLHGLERTGE